MDTTGLPPIPAKRYFTIGEVSELCAVKPYVLRYWEQEFSQLRPMKRRGNRRYYQHHEVLLIRRIRELLYEEGFTIIGARNRLVELGSPGPSTGRAGRPVLASGLRSVVAGLAVPMQVDAALEGEPGKVVPGEAAATVSGTHAATLNAGPLEPDELRAELLRIRALLEI
jgi:DNA-binding transcriptional MerR regulator